MCAQAKMEGGGSEKILSDDTTANVTKPKRRKTSRACNHCHKAHMTCDTGRPCKRCVQRGLEGSCEDAPRKRKKYLADVPNVALGHQVTVKEKPENIFNAEEGVFQRPVFQSAIEGSNGFPEQNAMTSKISFDQPIMTQQPQASSRQASSTPRVEIPLASTMTIGESYRVPRRTNFLSSAADLEYSTLSNILQDGFSNPTPPEKASNSISPALSPHTFGQGVTSTSNDLRKKHQQHVSPYFSGSSSTSSPNEPSINNRPISTKLYNNSHYPKCDDSINHYFLTPIDSDCPATFPDLITAIEMVEANDPAVLHERNARSKMSLSVSTSEDDNNFGIAEHEFKEPEEIYAKVTKPFSYTPGFHSLIAYLRKRFPKQMLVKMAESMASYRPSFIACTNSLKEGDLIFMEQCFQRTLLTYDSFIKISGTPTIVWRRTGEIAYVGNEFCMLTGWSKEDLVGGKRKFIVELLDDKSVLEYFQLFSRIAFGDFLGATMTECTLLTPKKDVKIRTGCIWTLKRDVFGIPMMIIGNFLPIL